MRRILYAVIGLLALFVIVRAYTQEPAASAGSRYVLHPGVLEFEGEKGGGSLAFGLLEGDARSERGATRTWSVFPVRLTLRSGKTDLSLTMGGLAFLTRTGVNIGRAVVVEGTRRGDLFSVGGPVTVKGRVEGDVWVLGADVTLSPGAAVTGDVVALGGTIESGARARIGGNKYSLPEVRIPLLGLLTSEHSAATFRFIVELLGVVLFLLLLFLAVHFAGPAVQRVSQILAARWRGSILYVALALLVLPAVLFLLIASIVGIILVPLVLAALLVAAYLGFVVVSVRLGAWLGRSGGGAGGAYTAGLLGLLVLRGPVLLGILFTLLASPFFQGLGRFLFGLGTLEMVVACLYGLGGILVELRLRRSAAAR